MPAPKIMPNYGVLNKIEKPFVLPRANTEKFNSVETIKSVVRDYYTPDALSNTGPYVGIVLRTEPEPTEGQPGSWYEKFFSGISSVPKLQRLKVRIPELHAMLPIPKSLGTESSDSFIIDMYPTFIAQNDSAELSAQVEDGALVWVDFGNKINFTDPIYIKPVKSASGAGAVGSTSGQGAFQGNCVGNLNSTPPMGDEISGKNKALSHSGLPLLPRKLNAAVGENVTIKGHRFNQLIVSTWEKEIKASGVPGKSWIGSINSNGSNDVNHKNGKRETIIYVPNVADFSSPIELIYYFHGYKEFNNGKDFQKRYPQAIKKMASEGRNFVLIIPELPWSNGSTKTKEVLSSKKIWISPDNFSNFHSEVKSILQESFSNALNVGYVSIISGDNSLISVRSAYESGLKNLKPNRIVMTEADESFFNDVVSSGIELNFVTVKNSVDDKKYNGIANKPNVLYRTLEVGKVDLMNQLPSFVYDGERTLPKSKSGSVLPPPKNADVSPSSTTKVTMDGKDKTNSAIVKDAIPYKEARVAVRDYGALSGNENILVPVPSVGSTQLLHTLAAKRLSAMNAAWLNDHKGYPPILVASGWRKSEFNSPAQYEQFLMRQVESGKYKSIDEGRKTKAFSTAHSTGLAFDIGNNGLSPVSATDSQQRQTVLYKWLVKNAHLYGITPYEYEAWHWEVKVPRESWASGQEFTDKLAVRVENPGQGGNLPMSDPTANKNCVAMMGNMTNNGLASDATGYGEVGEPIANAGDVQLYWNDLAESAKPGAKPKISDYVRKGNDIAQKYGDVIRKYQGDVPFGLICVRIAQEVYSAAMAGKDGKVGGVTACCGETGIMSIWLGKPFAQDRKTITGGFLKYVKMKPDFDPFKVSDNLWAGMSDWNMRGNRVGVQYGKWFDKPDEQFWGIIHMGMNIGEPLVKVLLRKVNPKPGNALNEVCAWVANQGSGFEQYKAKGWFGTQSAASVARRVLMTSYIVKAAQQVQGSSLLTRDFGNSKPLPYA